ncbi:MAG: carboxypeptidase-like regulatory domain-containing protein [Syntrophales bacterium]|nr:carboxypeptidase-like regulatory domain-containing protein [Syntrophales bacterium]MDD5640695.1 carboxypeptidase-like regulatory domain-containing protein [Syntrophales bacterium]
MKTIGALLGLLFLIMLAWGEGHSTPAQPPPAIAAAPETVSLPGVLTDAQGKPAAKAKITVTYHDKSYEATSGEGGKFDIADIDISPRLLIDLTGKLTDPQGQPLANTTVQFQLYDTAYKAITDASGVFVIKDINLARSLKDCYIPFFLLIPGIFGLVWAWIKDWQGPEKDPEAKIAGTVKKENQFGMALLNAAVWTITLLLLALFGVRKLHFFSSQLEFDFYVPILGFLGALLYMFHMFQKGEEKVPKGKEFGMRVLLAPYVAIIMVVLFGRDLGLVNLDSTAGRGTLAFFSGLLVITALQKIIENGQERLGRWREASRYEASEIAREFKLTLEEDLKLRKGDLAYLVQLEQYSEDQLREKARKIGFDEYLLVGLKRKCPKILLKKEIGNLVWGRLKKIGVREIEDFAQLSDPALAALNKGDNGPEIDTAILKKLRDRAREVCLPSGKPAAPTTAASQAPQEPAASGEQAG